MKIERDKPKEAKEFKPVVLNITIESKEELLNLYQRLYIDDETLKNIFYSGSNLSVLDKEYDFFESSEIGLFYHEVYDIVQEKERLGEI